ncbi:hypothetical protein BPOR_0900g00030 [Botrytis porri]|uniref:Uncharacterized protein n=1 Tax=Botrytis porri TaxID=87229 RepID=A0A4Z1KF67_9HELO|nr:hypothetical protein BPOR_0900g00030 [Botrytis porri]
MRTYLNCGELVPEANEASAERPGSCGSEALWCKEEFTVEVEDGREIGSMGGMIGNDCLPSLIDGDIRKGGRSRLESPEEGRR